MAEGDDWKKANADAIASLSSSVISSTATGHQDVALAGAEVVVYITNNIFSLSTPQEVDQPTLEGLQSTATTLEQTATGAGVPNTYIFQLMQDRDNALRNATTPGQKAEIWALYAAGMGKVIDDWAGILKPLGGKGSS